MASQITPPIVATISYRAVCGTCAWEGRITGNNLTALRDFDRHVTTAHHHRQVEQAKAELEPVDEDGIALCECCRDAYTYTQGLCPWCIEACEGGIHVPFREDA